MKLLLSAVLALLLSVGTVAAALAYGGHLPGPMHSSQSTESGGDSNAP
jgi:hypothetical protein